MISYARHAHFAPYTIHFLQTCGEIGATNRWLGSHTSSHILMQLAVKLRWLHLRDHFPSPLLHMAASMILNMVPYVDVVLIFVGRMLGGETHWLDVSLGNENSHTFYAPHFNRSMGDGLPCYVFQQ